MKTTDIISTIKNEVNSKNELFENYFADAIESANDLAIDSTIEAFNLENVEFFEDGISGIEDIGLQDAAEKHYFETFKDSLKLKVKGIINELK